jgi:hypothetical protein
VVVIGRGSKVEVKVGLVGQVGTAVVEITVSSQAKFIQFQDL